MTTDSQARTIFTVLDEENSGFITVAKFKAAFLNFYKNSSNEKKDEHAFFSLIDQMKPDEEGKIYFDNFENVFQQMESGKIIGNKGRKYEKYSIRRFLSAETTGSSNDENSDVDQEMDIPNGLYVDHEPNSKPLNEHSIHSEYKIRQTGRCPDFEDIGLHGTWPKRRLSLNVASLGLPSATSRARELLSAGASPRDSEVHSEVLCHEIGNNFDFLQMQMKRLQEKIESFHSDQNDIDGQQSKRLKEDNTILTRRLNNLEYNLRELEERSQTRLLEEKKDIKSRLTRAEDEKNLELESFRNRHFKLEGESADLTLEIRQFKDESEKLRAEKHLLTESLVESDTRLNNLQENFENLRTQSKLNVENLKKERDGYEKLILEVHDKSKTASIESIPQHHDIGELSSRHKELENLVDKLKDENMQLLGQLEDAHKDLSQRAKRDNEEMEKLNDDLHRELEQYNKTELMDILVKEKDANFKLKDYIEKIIVKVMEKHPALLEVAGTVK